jgi:dTDP-4-amino-4,6-dideoxygalactose transaminase
MSSSNTSHLRFLRLDRLFREHRDQYVEAVEKTLESGQVVGGSEVERFETRIAERSGRRHAIAVASGTDAMMVLLASLELSRECSCVVPAYTFVATASPLRHRGITPQFVDVDDYYHLDLRHLRYGDPESGRKTMIVVGLFGQNVDYPEFERFCAGSGILLIEDAAQSFGSFSGGRPGGNLGIASTFSFAPTKPLPCFGNLGAVVTDDDDLADRARRVRYHGRSSVDGEFSLLGFNSLPSAVSAAMLNVSLDHFEETQATRNHIAESYLSGLGEMEGLILPKVRPGTIPNWHKFVVRHAKRDALRNHMFAHGVETQVHYPRILPDSPIFSGSPGSNLETARRLVRESLTLPLHAQMTDDEVGQVVETMLGFGVG